MRTTKNVKTFSIDLTMGLPSCADRTIGWWAHQEPSLGRGVWAGREPGRCAPRLVGREHGTKRLQEALAPIAVRDHAL
ncbi:MAG: hypothetical protein ACRDRX_15720 [Pseudonocardiaceae bacterium]